MPNQSTVSTVVMYCAIARVSRPPAPAAPTPAAPAAQVTGSASRPTTAAAPAAAATLPAAVRLNSGFTSGSGGFCAGRTPTVLGQLVELLADSLDFRLVVLDRRAHLRASFRRPSLSACSRLSTVVSRARRALLPVRVARDVVKAHLVGHLEVGLEVVELGLGAHGAVDDQPAVLGSRHDVGVESVEAAFLAADVDGLRAFQQARRVGVEVALVETEAVHHGVTDLPQDAPPGDGQSGLLMGVFGEDRCGQLLAGRQFAQRLELDHHGFVGDSADRRSAARRRRGP